MDSGGSPSVGLAQAGQTHVTSLMAVQHCTLKYGIVLQDTGY